MIIENRMPENIVAMFRELEHCANEQLLRHADELDRKIAALILLIHLPSGAMRQVDHPFIAHGTALSFKLQTEANPSSQ